MEQNIYKLSENYNLYREEFGEGKFFLFDLEEGSIFRLNEVSYTMLSFFDGKKNTGEIFSQLLETYDTDEKTLKEDFFSLLEEWTNQKIIIIIKEDK